MAFPLSKLLDDVVRLCPLPATTKKVIELADSDRASIASIVQAISSDPALATAVLRVANSALYAGMKVAQLDAAVIRIGMRELKDLASAMSVLAAFRSKDPVQASMHERSILAGAIANKFAKVTRAMTPSTASTCGLLCEIGAMACFAVDGKEYSKLWKETSRDVALRAAREVERYTVTSVEIGRRFLERNSVPEEIASAVGAEFGADSSAFTPAQKVSVIARQSAWILQTFGADDEGVTTALLDEVMQAVAFGDLDGKGLYELFLREGLMRDLGRR